MSSAAAPRLRALSKAECLERLKSAAVGRIGISVGALPVILPVNYAVVDHGILFRTGRGTKLAAATHNAVVAFEADSFAGDGTGGWSVLVRGVCAEVTDPDDLGRMRDVPLDAWVADEDTDRYVRIALTEISGRGFGPS